MFILAHLVVTEEVIRQNKVSARAWLSVTLCPKMASRASRSESVVQHLLAGPDFLDPMEHMLEGRSHAHFARYDGFRGRRRSRKLLAVIGSVSVHLPGPVRQIVFQMRDIHYFHADVLQALCCRWH